MFKRYLLFFTLLALFTSKAIGQQPCPVPLYTDPNFRGAADPEVIWNEEEQEWWIFYTSRRAVCEGAPLPALAIGVASSKDWREWEHKGYIKIDGVGGTATGGDILWAPGIVRDGEEYHMFLTFKKGNGRGERWGISESMLLHLKAPKEDLLNGWQTYKVMHLPFSSIDATLLYDGELWHLYHRGLVEGKQGVNTFELTTSDLNLSAEKWHSKGALKGDINNMKKNGYHYQEAPFVFKWKETYWMMTDYTSGGIPLYSSKDLAKWTFVDELLREDSNSPFDKGLSRHPGVVVLEDRAFVFYFCQPNLEIVQGKESGDQTCYINVRELEYKDGKISVDRNKEVIPPKDLKPKGDSWGF